MLPSLLTNVINGCTFMTHEPSQQCEKGRTPQPCTRVAWPVRRAARCRGAVGRTVLNLPTAGLPLPSTSSAAQTASSGERSQAGIYGQAPGEFDQARQVLCDSQGPVLERGGEPGIARAIGTRTRAWVSRSRLGDVLCTWNIDLIVCCQRSWLRSIRHWSPRIAGQRGQRSRSRQSQHRR